MFKIIYVNRNLQTKEADLADDYGNIQAVKFIEDCFVICVIVDGYVISHNSLPLTPLERYAMASNAFNFMNLQDADFRLSNTMFDVIPYFTKIFKEIAALNSGGGSGEPPVINIPETVIKFPFTVPVRQYFGISQEYSLSLNYDGEGWIQVGANSDNNSVRVFVPAQYIYRKNQVIQVANLFFFFSGELEVGQGVYMNPFENTFQFHFGTWKAITNTVDSSNFSTAKGNYIIYKNEESGAHCIVSTTPIDNGIISLIN